MGNQLYQGEPEGVGAVGGNQLQAVYILDEALDALPTNSVPHKNLNKYLIKGLFPR